jgi:alpha-galactosidase
MRAHFSNGGVDLLLEVIDGALVISYWGKHVTSDLSSIPKDLPIPNSDFDETQFAGFVREHARGFLGHPMISGHRNGKSWSTKFAVIKLEGETDSAVAILEDKSALLKLEVNFKISSSGIIELFCALENQGDTYILNEFIYWLPLPDRVDESLDFTGRWSNERNPNRRDLSVGRQVRDSREGRSGHNGTVGQIALTKRTNFAEGEAWALALAWSGNHQYLIERDYQGSTSIGAGELFAPGEVILNKGERYVAPKLLAAYTECGLDGISKVFHRYLRARNSHPKSPRPVTLNLWEAIYFNHSEAKVKELIDRASDIGVERIVLDDGWFGSRRSDRAGLGDWQVSNSIWPNGLKPISDYAKTKGINFGLWFEGEMVNPDSELFRTHPEWVLGGPGRVSSTWRHQLVLDLSKTDAFNYIFESVSKVIKEAGISYIKWDHNRVLIDAESDGRPSYRDQVFAIYRLFDQLKDRHPGLEIEACASGGARVDLGMVDHVDRFWVSDNNDALERQRIQSWTAQFIPLELLGAHIGPSPSHQTGRSLSLQFRAITALFGHSGIEWDISKCTSEEIDFLTNWIKYYKSKRELIHSGDFQRIDYPDRSHHLYGVFSRSESIVAYAQLETIPTSQPPRIRIRDLDDRNYEIRIPEISRAPGMMLIKPPAWISEGCKMSGRVLGEVGLPAPILKPGEAILFEIHPA